MKEKRSEPRHKSLLRGYVYFDGGPCAVGCMVREISDAGARLKFDKSPLPAKRLQLNIPVRGQQFHADVKWQQDDEIGVMFTDASDAAIAPSAGSAEPAGTPDELAARVMRLEGEIAELQHLIKRLQQKVNSKVEAA
jgi:hypothetical protein